MPDLPVLPFFALMLVPLAGMVVADVQHNARAYGPLKLLGSAVFVVAGARLLTLTDVAARVMLVGLVLSFVGDALLIAKGKRRVFLLGLAAFLLAHVAYAVAFVVHGADARACAVAAGLAVVAGIAIARWLMPKVTLSMRAPVIAYMLTITMMVVLAAGASAQGARPTLLAGAVLFFLSDILVARERFVVKDRLNGTLGLPLYFVAQLLLVDGLTH